MARSPAKVKFDWLHFGWSLLILVVAVSYWLGMWAYVDVPMEYVGEIYFLVIPTLFLVLASFAITPDVPLLGEFSVRAYYWKNRLAIFVPLAAMVTTSSVADLVIVGIEKVGFGSLPFTILTGLILVYLAFTKRVWFHALVLGSFSVAMLAYFFTEAAQIDNSWQTKLSSRGRFRA